jgi:2-polyprenyl-3-methyl-5-hydroxy-6-metoxy-1,4-benzoquinol methylase
VKNNFFKKDYSLLYDLIYSKKDYKAETKLISKIIKKFFTTNVNILDIGCGTGQHTLELLKQGYKVTGIDLSNEMLKIAKKKLLLNKLFFNNLFNLNAYDVNKLNTKFDVVLMMFNVIGYLDNIEFLFQKLRNSLKPNALIVFDYWSETAVKKNPPKTTTKNFLCNEFKATKISKGKIIKNKVIVDLNLNIIKGNQTKRFNETHNVYFYDIRKLAKTLKKFGYKKKNIDLNKEEKLFSSKSQWEKFCLLKYEKKNTSNS